jgi:putative PIN family toxin of toxin-antitoxin system
MVVVVDTNVLVAATLSPFGASFQILSLLPERRFELLLSVPLMLEYEEVLKREDMRAQSHLTLEEVDVLLDMLAAVGTPCTPFFQWRPQLSDPDDEMVLELGQWPGRHHYHREYAGLSAGGPDLRRGGAAARRVSSEATIMSHYALDLPETLLQEAQAVAQAAQTSLDDFVRLAIAEKIAAARTAQYFRTRAARADPEAFLAVLERIKQAAGPVVVGDEL